MLCERIKTAEKEPGKYSGHRTTPAQCDPYSKQFLVKRRTSNLLKRFDSAKIQGHVKK